MAKQAPSTARRAQLRNRIINRDVIDTAILISAPIA